VLTFEARENQGGDAFGAFFEWNGGLAVHQNFHLALEDKRRVTGMGPFGARPSPIDNAALRLAFSIGALTLHDRIHIGATPRKYVDVGLGVRRRHLALLK
jgi:hypothetical protein